MNRLYAFKRDDGVLPVVSLNIGRQHVIEYMDEFQILFILKNRIIEGIKLTAYISMSSAHANLVKQAVHPSLITAIVEKRLLSRYQQYAKMFVTDRTNLQKDSDITYQEGCAKELYQCIAIPQYSHENPCGKYFECESIEFEKPWTPGSRKIASVKLCFTIDAPIFVGEKSNQLYYLTEE